MTESEIVAQFMGEASLVADRVRVAESDVARDLTKTIAINGAGHPTVKEDAISGTRAVIHDQLPAGFKQIQEIVPFAADGIQRMIAVRVFVERKRGEQPLLIKLLIKGGICGQSDIVHGKNPAYKCVSHTGLDQRSGG